MTQPATPTGAGGGRIAPHLSRLEMLNQTGKGRVDALNKELAEVGSPIKVEFEPITIGEASPDNDDHDRDGEAAPNAAGNQTDDVATTAAAAAAVENEDAPIFDFLGEDRLDKTKVKIKVDGQEKEITVADALKTVQKNAAADKRLEEAALAKKRAEEEAATIVATARSEAEKIKLAAKPAGEEPKPGESPSTPDAMTQAVTLMFEGDTQKSAEHFAAAVKVEVDRRLSESGATLDRAALTREVRQQMEWDAALEEFTTNHQDIADDPYLLGMWQAELNRAAKLPEVGSPKDAVQKATQHVADWMQKIAGGSAGGQKVTVGDLATRRTEKTAALRNAVHSTTSVPASTAKSAPKPQKPSEVVADMRKARGQAS